MIANHIHDALAQVRRLRELVLEKRKFRGYSGKARIASGIIALVAAAVMASNLVGDDPYFHLIGWGIVLVAGIVLNYSALLYWFLFDDHVRRNPVMLRPALDALPALSVGAALSATLVYTGQYWLLPGVWMCLYGLAQVTYRHSLPSGIYAVGLFYIVCGAAHMMSLVFSFTNPWPMGIVFFLGELAGGCVLMREVPNKAKTETSDDH